MSREPKVARGARVTQNRVVVIGNTCAGKTTFGRKLAAQLSLPFTDLDALYWQRGWLPVEAEEFRRRVEQATRAPEWVLVGNYLSKQQAISWMRATRVIWLDIALPIVVARVLSRSFQRWRSRELLWGTNRESFWRLFRLWDPQVSLLAWAVTQHHGQRRKYAAILSEARWEHLEFQRFTSTPAAEAWLATFRAGA